jgi:phenylpyruvate tautomerase PptA (4-oxalocrotonate tautomerase family)
MPIYKCFSPKEMLNASQKAQIAEKITDIHCEATGAPRSFVNVLFLPIEHGDNFADGKVVARSYIYGDIRHGRDIETQQNMLHKLTQMWVDVTGQSNKELLAVLSGMNPATIMEAGEILPETNHADEEKWLKKVGAH